MIAFAESTAAAALANLDEALETLRRAQWARTDGGAMALVDRALVQVANARAKLADAMTLEEMAVVTGEEEEAANDYGKWDGNELGGSRGSTGDREGGSDACLRAAEHRRGV